MASFSVFLATSGLPNVPAFDVLDRIVGQLAVGLCMHGGCGCGNDRHDKKERVEFHILSISEFSNIFGTSDVRGLCVCVFGSDQPAKGGEKGPWLTVSLHANLIQKIMAESKENIRKLLETRVLEHRDKPFLFAEADGRAWTYREFDATVNRTANMLRSHGISKGDVVSLLLPNSPEYIIAYFACWKIGAVAGPVNSLLKVEEIEWVVGNSESKLLLSDSSLTVGAFALPVLMFDDIEAATGTFSDNLDAVDLDSNHYAIIIYTSGTTGKPKGCLLTPRQPHRKRPSDRGMDGFRPG